MAERTRGYAHRVNIDAPLELVWRGLTEPALLTLWCGPGARVSARAAGNFYVRMNGDMEREARIDVFNPGRRLRLIYLPPRELPESEAVIVEDFMLETEQGVAVLRLLGSGFPLEERWEPHFVRVRAGWGLALARLKVCMEQIASGKEPGQMKLPGTR